MKKPKTKKLQNSITKLLDQAKVKYNVLEHKVVFTAHDVGATTKKVSIAKEKDILTHLKTKVGLLHPFGSQYKIQTLLDKGMTKSKKMIASAGSFTHSVELGLKDFEKLVQPLKGAFSKAKK